MTYPPEVESVAAANVFSAISLSDGLATTGRDIVVVVFS